MKTLAIIPAGGSGTRVGGEMPKQYLLLVGSRSLCIPYWHFRPHHWWMPFTSFLPVEDVKQAPQKILSLTILPNSRHPTRGRARQDSVKRGRSYRFRLRPGCYSRWCQAFCLPGNHKYGHKRGLSVSCGNSGPAGDGYDQEVRWTEMHTAKR